MPDNANQRKINNSLDALKKQVGDLYTSTYYTQDNSEEMKTQVQDRLDDAIRRSTQGDEEYKNISNTSKLFRKALSNNGKGGNANTLISSFGKGDDKDITAIFENPNIMASIMDSYSKTKWITQLDQEFDLICKYMTKLQTALDIKRDAVLCSDSYTKEFLTVRAKGENPSSDKNVTIQNNINEMIKKYKLSDNAEKWYDDTSKYGEEFVYCIPYDIALNQLLRKKKDTSYIYTTESTVSEKDLKNLMPKNAKGTAVVESNENGFSIKIKLDKSKIIDEVVDNNLYLRKALGDVNLRGLSETYLNERDESFEKHLHKDGNKTEVKLDTMFSDSLEWEDDDKTAASGLTDMNKREPKLKVNGAIVKAIKHDRVIPIYIEDTLFGCYYIKFNQYEDTDINSSMNIAGYNSINGMFDNGPNGIGNGNMTNSYREERVASQDMMLRQLAGIISQKIDAAFINANTDLKKEIYLMLKFNDDYNQAQFTADMNVLFIPADDIHHLKFREDPDTHRGISDLWDALVPAKQWITLTLTSVLGWTTRGFDRRVYYVRQSLDTNVAQSLLNVIATIKKGNFGIRQMESVNNILGILGRFNDFVIPVGSDGNAPITFDTQPGQQFEFPEALTGNLEESAVNSTGVPLEIVNSSTGMDFAVRYTMTNAKLLRNVLKRQLKMEDFLSEVFTKIYRFEYNDPVELEVILPPPAYLSMTQGVNLLNSATQYADAITEVEMAGQPDEVKVMFKRRLIRKFIPSYISDDELQKIKENIAIENNIEKSRSEEDME